MDSESFGKGFANGDFWVVHGYAEIFIKNLMKNKEHIQTLYIPEKGDTAYVDSFVILKDAPNKEAAYKFLEFIHRPENYKLVSEHLELPSINVPARELIEVEPIYKMEDLKGSEILRDIKKTLDIQNKYWQEIMVD
ncbi:extracellular solute-binding protein [Cetobacterium sp. 2A]|uniref:extracellular solute-binding protein n=1 Tax=Cetobacterium sp. 2A TaxID=2754723 RepID=UPI00351AE63C